MGIVTSRRNEEYPEEMNGEIEFFTGKPFDDGSMTTVLLDMRRKARKTPRVAVVRNRTLEGITVD
jgi:hypothetical protein